MKSTLMAFLPTPSGADRTEKIRASAGAMFGLLITGLISYTVLGSHSASLIAPMGASAVLLFCLPASPLAQPWSIVAGNMVSALIGVTCAHYAGTSSAFH